ncbi:MAG: hypothetical protein Q9218_000344 [Villophora microphyllina]
MSTPHRHSTRLTLTPAQNRRKSVENSDGDLYLVAKAVIGSSVVSTNTLSASVEANIFAFSAGSIVVLALINPELSLDQRLVCVKPNAVPRQVTPSYYNHATPTKAAGNRNNLNSPFRDDSPASTDRKADSISKAKSVHRPRSVTSISLSPSGRYLAVGEVIQSHRAMESLNLELKTADRVLSAVGTRHVKVWRLEQTSSSPLKTRRVLDSISDGTSSSPMPRTFTGRNCLLGPLQDAVFSCVVGISEDKAVLCTQDGTVCLLDDASRSQRLVQVTKTEYSITCATLDESAGVVWIGGKGIEPEAIPLVVLLYPQNPPTELEIPTKERNSLIRKGVDKPDITAMCCVDRRLITTDTNHCIAIYDSVSVGDDALKALAMKRFPSHDSAVLGVIILPKLTRRQSDFLTYSENGRVLCWLWNGTCTSDHLVLLVQPLGQGPARLNGLRILRIVQTYETLLAGDRAGVLRLLDADGAAEICAIKAHDGEIHDLTLQNLGGDDSVAASCGKDRTIQIFRISRDECLLQQSLINEHAGPIRKLELADNANILASMSSDRTIVLHNRVSRMDDSIAFVSTRLITLKASPVSMSLVQGMSPILLVSTADRCVQKIGLTEGNVVDSFKTSDHSGGESVILSRLSVGVSHQLSARGNVVAGFSSSDGSIRLYNAETGFMLAAVQGQSAISDLAIAETPDHDGCLSGRIVSTGFDGTTVVWHLTSSAPHSGLKHDFGEIDPSKPPSQSDLRPLRRVISKTEIADFQRTLKDGGDAPISSRTLSPSRVYKKSSRCAISEVFKVPGSKIHAAGAFSKPFAGGDKHQVRLMHGSPPLSPRVGLQSRSRRSSLDGRQGKMVVRSDTSINSIAKHVSDTLQAFRKRIATSKEYLDHDVAQRVQQELQATLTALAQRARLFDSQDGDTATDRESFDDYLGRLIDDRLALRLGSEDQKNTVEGSQAPNAPSTSSSTKSAAESNEVE